MGIMGEMRIMVAMDYYSSFLDDVAVHAQGLADFVMVAVGRVAYYQFAYKSGEEQLAAQYHQY